jgi:DNA mismatch endonuclease (patch repair protein)
VSSDRDCVPQRDQSQQVRWAWSVSKYFVAGDVSFLRCGWSDDTAAVRRRGIVGCTEGRHALALPRMGWLGVGGAGILIGMADIFTKAKRSEVMARIRSRGNRDTEGAMVSLLRAAGIKGWNRHVEVRIKEVPAKVRSERCEGRSLPRSEGRGAKSEVQAKRRKGKAARSSLLKPRPFKVRPDFVWRKERVALFVDGCFWHGCRWHGTKPASNKSFWQTKLKRNRERDRLVSRRLRKAGWRVVRVWEHVLPRAARDVRERERLVGRIRMAMVDGG